MKIDEQNISFLFNYAYFEEYMILFFNGTRIKYEKGTNRGTKSAMLIKIYRQTL